MNTLWQDIRYGFRMLVKNPGFTAVAVLTLALGIGANTAIFSFVNAILLRPLPVKQPDRLVSITEVNREKDPKGTASSPRNIEDWQRSSKTIEEFGAWRDWGFSIKGPEVVEGIYSGIASPSLFHLLGVTPAKGRIFLPEEDQPGRNRVVLISDGCWKRRFGADPNILEKKVTLSREGEDVYTIIGVLPAEFDLPSMEGIQMWAPLSVDPDQSLGRWLRNRQVIARLKEGTSVREAQLEMATIADQLAQQYPDTNKDWSVRVTPLHEAEVGSTRAALLTFLAAVGFVLLIGCVNIANLMLGRATARQREFAVRTALGAGRARLVRLLLTEGLLLGLAGGAAGLLLSLWTSDVFVALSPPSLPRLEQISFDVRVFEFALAVSLLAGLLSSVFPALQSSRVDITSGLKEGGGSSTGRSSARVRSFLLAGQVALVMVLLTAAGLLTQSFARLQMSPLGFEREHLMTFQVFPPSTKYPKARDVASFYQRLTDELKGIPSVQAVASASAGPFFGGVETVEFSIEGRPQTSGGGQVSARFFDVSAGYFGTMGIPLRKGREFTSRDAAESPLVAVVNETCARRYWPDSDPVGQRMVLGPSKAALEIVGIAGDVQRPRAGAVVEPEIYWPNQQHPRWASYFMLRTAGDPAAIGPAVRSRIGAIDKDVLIGSMRTMDERIGMSLRNPRFNTLVVAFFAMVALLLAAVGIYGVVSYAVAQRTHEIGVRMALGADRGTILRLVMWKVLWLTACGALIGLACALASGRLLTSLLYNVSPADPATLLGVSALLAFVAMVACFIPARRATKVDPLIALRYE